MIDQIQKTLVKIDPQVNKNSKDSIKSKDIDNSLSVPTPADAADSADISKLAKSDNVAGLSASAPIDYDQVKAIINESVEAIQFLLNNDITKTMNKYN